MSTGSIHEAPKAQDSISPKIEKTTVEAIVREGVQEKKKRGRPPKSTSAQSVSDIPKGAIETPSTPLNPQPAQSLPDFPPEALKPVINFPFHAIALQTGFDGWELNEAEVDTLVPLVDACLKQYAPQALGPHTIAVTLGVTLVMFSGMKYMTYLKWRKDVVKKFDRSNVPSEIPAAS